MLVTQKRDPRNSTQDACLLQVVVAPVLWQLLSPMPIGKTPHPIYVRTDNIHPRGVLDRELCFQSDFERTGFLRLGNLPAESGLPDIPHVRVDGDECLGHTEERASDILRVNATLFPCDPDGQALFGIFVSDDPLHVSIR